MPTASFLPSQLHRFVSVNKLKYFFAVDTAYVAKKLGLLVFPYTHQVSFLSRELVGLPHCAGVWRPDLNPLLSSFFSSPPDVAAAATARTGKCSTVAMFLCPLGKTSTPLTSISPVSLRPGLGNMVGWGWRGGLVS